MMIKNRESGYEEQPHTADWALKVWAADLPELFRQAALGMCSLIHMELESSPRLARTIQVEGHDLEDLLVGFLGELLYLAELHSEGYDYFDLTIQDGILNASLAGAPIRQHGKEIKAVTYHQLQIRKTAHGLETVIIFDV
jgi:SHS2 domain-containing protein